MIYKSLMSRTKFSMYQIDYSFFNDEFQKKYAA